MVNPLLVAVYATALVVLAVAHPPSWGLGLTLLLVHLAGFVGFVTANIRLRRKNLYYPNRWKGFPGDVVNLLLWPITFPLGVLIPTMVGAMTAWRARRTSSAATLLAWAESNQRYESVIHDLRAQVARSEARVQAATEFLAWVEHSPECNCRKSVHADCSCGLDHTFSRMKGVK